MEPEGLLRHVRDTCQQLELTYLVVGSMATIAYGEPRFTNDIDVAIDLPTSKIAKFCAAFPSDDFYVSQAAVEQAVAKLFQFNVIHPASGLKVDFMVLSESEFDKSRTSRRRSLPVFEDGDASFASPEDVIVKKLVYYEEGKSEKHLRDIESVLDIQGDKIDREYIAYWAQCFSVLSVWQALLAEDR
jgi:hypothetical protein